MVCYPVVLSCLVNLRQFVKSNEGNVPNAASLCNDFDVLARQVREPLNKSFVAETALASLRTKTFGLVLRLLDQQLGAPKI
jgi:hypothetical protein